MYPTKNDLPERVRKKMIALLNERLAEAIDLRMRAKDAHWNVKGPTFLMLHELFDRIAEAADEWSDDLGERAVQLGGCAEGLPAIVVERASLGSYDGADFVTLLSQAMGRFGECVRKAIDEAAKAGDQDSADLFTGISRGSDKHLWFLEAHATKA